MSPEALARLRFVLERFPKSPSYVVQAEDLRALLDAYDTARAELSGVRMALQGESPATLSGLAIRVSYEIGARKAVLRDLQAVERERDTARAEGVAAERAHVVADLRARAEKALTFAATRTLQADADRYERGEHDKEETIPSVLIFGFPPVNP